MEIKDLLTYLYFGEKILFKLYIFWVPDGSPEIDILKINDDDNDGVHRWFKWYHRWMNTWNIFSEIVESSFQTEYWRILTQRDKHVAVQNANVDTKFCGSGFPTEEDSPNSRYLPCPSILVENILGLYNKIYTQRANLCSIIAAAEKIYRRFLSFSTSFETA